MKITVDDISKLRARIQELESEVERLRKWENPTIEVCAERDGNPFHRYKCKIVDVGVADRIFVVECPELVRERDTRKAQLDAVRGACESVVATAHGNTNGLDAEEVAQANQYAAYEVIRVLGVDWARQVLSQHGHDNSTINAILSGKGEG
jgi:hypothetical protein